MEIRVLSKVSKPTHLSPACARQVLEPGGRGGAWDTHRPVKETNHVQKKENKTTMGVAKETLALVCIKKLNWDREVTEDLPRRWHLFYRETWSLWVVTGNKTTPAEVFAVCPGKERKWVSTVATTVLGMRNWASTTSGTLSASWTPNHWTSSQGPSRG